MGPAREHLRLETVVVDNGSTDGSPARIASRFRDTQVICLGRNLGFSTANNVGLAATSGRHRLLLNPDCFVHPGCLESLVAYADSHPAAGLVGPRLLNLDGSRQASCRTFPTLGALALRNTPLGRLMPDNRWTSDYLMERASGDEPQPADWLSGACLLIQEPALAALGGLDERFFMYCEDMDWCYRAWQGGWEVVYLPAAVATHRIGRSSDQRPVAMVKEHHRSMWRYVDKHYGAAASAVAAPLIFGRLGLVLAAARWS